MLLSTNAIRLISLRYQSVETQLIIAYMFKVCVYYLITQRLAFSGTKSMVVHVSTTYIIIWPFSS